MELITLSPTFQPDLLVESYESLIWTERYGDSGDFEIVSSDIQNLINLLPRETCISIRESTVPMIVENHKIMKPKNDVPKVSITGRSFETVLERRASVRNPMGTPRTAWMIAAASESNAAFMAMRYVLGDVAQYKGGPQVLPAVTPAISPNDAISEITLTLPADFAISAWSASIMYAQADLVGVGTTIYQATALANNFNKPPASNPTFWTVLFTGQSGTWGPASRMIEISPSNLYGTIIDLISANHHGFKAVRPQPGNSKVAIEIYNGADLTQTVVFDARFDQIDGSTYLLSEQGSTNVAYVYGNETTGSEGVLKTAAPEPTGLKRRVLLVDCSSDTTVVSSDNRKSRGLIELYKYNATALVDGEVSEQVAEGFNRDYFLGDILKLVADYGLTRNVRVAEFIRTSDATGERAYPAFEAVD
jgi:Siphovirus ReqiPepy6 Gp37-like protein